MMSTIKKKEERMVQSPYVVDGQNICFLNSVWKGCMQEYIQEGKSWKPQYYVLLGAPHFWLGSKLPFHI